MKSLKISLLALLITATTFAQDCSSFYPFTEGTTATVTSYNKKGKVSGSQKTTIKAISIEGGYTTANTQAILKDKNGKTITETDYKVRCKNNGVEIDISAMMSPDLFDQFEGMETEITGTTIVLPNNLAVGDALPDAAMKMAVDMSGITMNMNVSMTNRKVISQENLTTPAGTFDCYVIEHTTIVKMGMARKSTAKQWIARGVGLVKQEEYNKKGKIISSSVLTSFSK